MALSTVKTAITIDEMALTGQFQAGIVCGKFIFDDVNFGVMAINSTAEDNRRCICCGAPINQVQHD